MEGHIDGKWDMPAHGGSGPLYVEAVLHLDKDLADLERLKEPKEPPVRQLRYQSREVSYLAVDASGKGFGSAMWRENMVECKSG